MPSRVITEKKIKDKINRALQEGFTLKQVKKELESRGWPEQKISKFIFSIKEKKLTDLPIKIIEKEKITKPEKLDFKKEHQIKIPKEILKPKVENLKETQKFDINLKIEKPIIPKSIEKELDKAHPTITLEPKKKIKITPLEIEENLPEIRPEEHLAPLEKKYSEPPQVEKIREEVKSLEQQIEVPPIQISNETQKEVKLCRKQIQKIRNEVSKIVVGQEKVVDNLLKALLANGHILMEGVPGIAKTLLIRALSIAIGCAFKRIQFTVDLLPTDIVGFVSYDQKKGFYTVKGPIFTNFIIADEINRATPKTQSALLEAMQERQVTIGKTTFGLPSPFFVMANKNPIESSGVYPLPEAQRDRFLLKVFVKYPTIEEERLILKQNISIKNFEDFDIKPILSPSRINKMQEVTKKVYLAPEIEKYIVRITNATRFPKKYNLEFGKYIEYGASPRASIGMFIASKADAILNGKSYVSPQNVKNVAHAVLRHRIILNYEAMAEKVQEDKIISEILSKIPVP
ncbi:hypothetical protein CL621_01290 [archaeon]|nr:hypothetical protein [archaeon]|tara:strand:+ start:1486 stop:3033 length:1548 start_codon:yes stop_codon:yes gene_type:complete